MNTRTGDYDMQFDDPSFFGTVTFGEPQAVQLAFPGDPQKTVAVTCEHGEWRPPDRLVPFLPDDFSLPLDCYRGPDRLRRIVPLCTFEELIDVGAVGGLAVLHGVRGFSSEVDNSYRAMFLIHQHVRGRAYGGTRGMKEHLTREFDYSRDLYVRRLGRTADDQRNVLPDDVGLNNHGEGHRLSVGQLTENGRRAAVKAGYRNPTSKHAIAFGLFQAAQLNPLEVQPEGVPALVRMALFDVDPSKDVPSEELLEQVKERLLEAIDSHLLDPQEEFDRWFVGPGNSLVKQIAQQKLKRGGELQREEVRGALLHLGWEAYGYVGQCVHALMRTVKNSMPDPLDDKEKRLFEQMHEGQPCFGDLPLALLAERSSFLRRAVLTIWHEPDDPNHVRILHRLLSYYSDVSRKRREADRQSKQASQHGLHASSDDIGTIGQAREERADLFGEDGDSEDGGHASHERHGGSSQIIENLHSPASSEENPFAEVAEYIRQTHQIAYNAGCVHWEYHREGESKESVSIAIRCEGQHVVQTITMSITEYAVYANEVLEWGWPAADGKESSGES